MRNFLLILLLLAVGAGAYSYACDPKGFAKITNDLMTDVLGMFVNSDDKTAPPAPSPAAPEWTPPAVIPAEQDWTWTTPDKIYRNVRITKIEADCVTITHADGAAVVQIWTLPADIQKRLNYNPDAATAAATLRQAAPPATEPVATPSASVAADSQSPPTPERNIYKEALVAARLSGKPILLHFDGSTYCPPCQLLDREVFSTASFQGYLKSNFILVTLDYTNDPPTTDPVKVEVHEKYHIQGVPTLVVIDANEKELGRLLGYGPGFGRGWVEDQLDAIVNKPLQAGSIDDRSSNER